MPDSTKLIESAQNGDRHAFERLVGLHYDFIFRVAFKWCRDRANAEDITQDACIRLARSIGGYNGKAAFTSWLYRLVINAAIDWQRRNRGAGAESVEQPDSAPDAEAQYYAREILARIDRLPVKEKTALLLVHAEGLTHAEAARVMECRESTVSGYIHQARKKLDKEQDAGQKERRHG